MHTPSDIQLILKSRIYEDEEEPLLAPLIASQQNIRGKSYYEGFHHE
jgi:hypothetical protein